MSRSLEDIVDPFSAKRRLERSPDQTSPPLKMGLCKVCNKSLRTEGPYVNCDECKNGYHTECTGQSEKYITFLKTMHNKYVCPACCVEECITSKAYFVTKLDEFMAKIDEKICGNKDNDLINLREMIVDSVSEAVKPLEIQMNDIKTEIVKNASRIDNLEVKVEEILKNPLTNSNATSINKEIISLKAQLLQNNLVISGISETKDEDIVKIVTNIGAKLNTNIAGQDIKRVFRLKRANPESETTSTPSKIVIEFVYEATMNRLMDNYLNLIRNKRYINCTHIGINSESRIYINKYLPKEIIQLFGKCNSLKKSDHIQHAIPRATYILVKFKDKWFKIFSEADLKSLFR